MNGMTGLCVVRNVEVEYLTGRGNVFPRNVHTLTLHTTSAMERIMKRRSVMKNAVKVCNINTTLTVHKLNPVICTCIEPDYFGEWSNWSKCSSSCGKGKKYRKRLCYKSKCPTDYRGCKGKYQEYADCDSGCCPSK